jgi:hypothetical protein
MTGMHITVREARIPELDAAGKLTVAAYRDGELAEDSYLPRLRDAAGRHHAEGATQLVAVDPEGGILGTVVYAVADTEYADVATGEQAEIRMLATSSAARGPGRRGGPGAGLRRAGTG